MLEECVRIFYMRVVLVITDTKGKNLIFSTDSGKAYYVDKAINLVKQNKIKSLHLVKTRHGVHLRSNPNDIDNDNLDALSISSHKLFLSINNIKYLASKDGVDAYKKYITLHGRSIKEKSKNVIYIDGFPLITREQIATKLTSHKRTIFAAAKEFSIDPYILGAIIIDEIARIHPWEDVRDKLFAVHLGINASVGIAQVTINTTRELIRKRYYNPNSNDKKMHKDKIMKTSKAYIYTYAVQPRHSIRFGAARIKQIIDHWSHKTDLSKRPEIIGTLYSQGLGIPKSNPGSNSRGLQIAQEFYPLAKRILES